MKIGRAAFDEDAIRLLEEQHPEVEFDWDRILTTKPPAAPETRDPRDARPPRRPDRRPAKDTRRDQFRPSPPPVVQAEPISTAGGDSREPDVPEPADTVVAAVPSPVEPPAIAAPVDAGQAPTQPLPTVTTVQGGRRFVRVFDAPAPAAAVPAHHATELSVAERLLGAEQLTRLRARYAEILARISARGGDPARVKALREQAASVDPDGWVTESDVTSGLARIDPTLAELHRIVGRRRRRRRRRREGPLPPATQAGTAAQPAPEDDADIDDGDDDAGLDSDDDGTPEE